MKRIITSAIVLATCLSVLFTACKKDEKTTNTTNTNNPNPTPTEPADTASAKKTCYEGSGSLLISNMGFPGFDCNLACASYADVSQLWPGEYQTTITFMNQTGFGQSMNFIFSGKSYPKTGTYKVATQYGFGATDKLAADEVVVNFTGPIATHKDAGNTIEVVNDNGKITLKSSKIELFDIAGNPKSVVSELNVTKSTTKK